MSPIAVKPLSKKEKEARRQPATITQGVKRRQAIRRATSRIVSPTRVNVVRDVRS